MYKVKDKKIKLKETQILNYNVTGGFWLKKKSKYLIYQNFLDFVIFLILWLFGAIRTKKTCIALSSFKFIYLELIHIFSVLFVEMFRDSLQYVCLIGNF